ncbi:hypothetical protein_gp142 [Bacillus phage vB_BceM_WH1]|nr:hypothetical protein_gp142 [Bacillus phage vB_BceM_WH1]
MQVTDVTYVAYIGGYIKDKEVGRFTIESAVEDDPDFEQMVEDRQVEMEEANGWENVYWDRE